MRISFYNLYPFYTPYTHNTHLFPYGVIKRYLCRILSKRDSNACKDQQLQPHTAMPNQNENAKTTARPISMQRLLGTCSQHYTIEFEVRQIPSSEIGKNLHVF